MSTYKYRAYSFDEYELYKQHPCQTETYRRHTKSSAALDKSAGENLKTRIRTWVPSLHSQAYTYIFVKALRTNNYTNQSKRYAADHSNL